LIRPAFEITLSCLFLAGAAQYASLRAQDVQLAVPTHLHYNAVEPLLSDGDGTAGMSTYKNPPSPICATATSSAPNVNTDCEGNAPHNETSIAVNPTNPLNLLASANDYQLRLSSGGQTAETVFSRAHVTTDGGKTWTTYPIYFRNYAFTGDPAAAFDANGTAYLSTLGFVASQGLGCCTNPDVVVATSGDGGKTWSAPVRVAAGSGSFRSSGVFNDKPYLTAWGHGNAIVTWTQFLQGAHGSYQGSPIYTSVTHDGGKTWSTPAQISGSASFCIGVTSDTSCNQSQGSTPVVAADGSIYVSFLSTGNLTTGRDQYLVVKVDPSTGQRVAGPYKVSDVFDGFTDYPINVDGRQTYQDSQFRTWALGNIAADPTNAAHLAVVWSDMRNSVLPAPADPYQAVTNSDVVASQSFDGGQTWSAPQAIAAAGDQFMPWSAYDGGGRLRIGYFDRSYDPANHQYGYTLATESAPGSLTFAGSQVTSGLSDPTANNRWFSAGTVNASFPNPTTFVGDYSGIAVAPGSALALWTDLRGSACYTARCGAAQDAEFATAP